MCGSVFRSTILQMRNSNESKLSWAPSLAISTRFLLQIPTARYWGLLKSQGNVYYSQNSQAIISSLGGKVMFISKTHVYSVHSTGFSSGHLPQMSSEPPLHITPFQCACYLLSDLIQLFDDQSELEMWDQLKWLKDWVCSSTEKRSSAGTNNAYLLNGRDRRESGIKVIKVWNTRCDSFTESVWVNTRIKEWPD